MGYFLCRLNESDPDKPSHLLYLAGTPARMPCVLARPFQDVYAYESYLKYTVTHMLRPYPVLCKASTSVRTLRGENNNETAGLNVHREVCFPLYKPIETNHPVTTHLREQQQNFLQHQNPLCKPHHHS